MNLPHELARYHDMITNLVADGWQPHPDQRTDGTTGATRTTLTCPANYLRAVIDMSDDGAVHCRLGIAPNGYGEPARWRASAAAPPPALWLSVARAAHHAVVAPQHVSLFPGDALVHLGWSQLNAYLDETSFRASYASPGGSHRVAYSPSQRAKPALWTITRPDASIGVLVHAAEPRALPALVLALALAGAHEPPRTINQPSSGRRPH